MERFFTNKRIWKKLIIIMLVIMAFQTFGITPVVRADDPDARQAGDNFLFAGILMRPIMSFFVTLADGVVNLLHSVIMGQDVTLITVEGDDWWEKAAAILVGILAAVAVMAVLSALVFGAVASFAAAAVAAIETKLSVAIVIAGVATGIAVGAAAMPDSISLPIYSYSAEEIFKGNILLFNVDFFDPDYKEVQVCYKKIQKKEGSDATQPVSNNNPYEQAASTTVGNIGNNTNNSGNTETEVGNVRQDEAEGIERIQNITSKYELSDEQYVDTYENYKNGTLASGSNVGDVQVMYYFYYKDGDSSNTAEDNIVKTSPQDSARELRKVISRWYVAIRNICIVLMLSILIYIGIRMMLTTVASEKAKYKDMITGWIVGLMLLFLMHYIMAFSVTIVEYFTEVVKQSVDSKMMLASLPDEYDNNLIQAMEDMGLPDEYIDKDNNRVNYPTNLMGLMRIEMQLKEEPDTGVYIAHALCFLVLVVFTVLFTFTYLKRLLYMAFLTVIAPLVATTYCIDKINDGSAQGFNMWLKEYLFNLLIQPLHLLLYFILITSAYELSSTNVLYSLVAIGFMLPAEKLLRSMFGFEKAKTPPLLGGAVGASLVMQGVSGLAGLAKGGRHGGNGADGKGKDKSDDESIPTNAIEGYDRMKALVENTGKDRSKESPDKKAKEPETDEDAKQKQRERFNNSREYGQAYNSWLNEAHPEEKVRQQEELARQQELNAEYMDTRESDEQSYDDWLQKRYPEVAEEQDRKRQEELERQQQLAEEFNSSEDYNKAYNDWLNKNQDEPEEIDSIDTTDSAGDTLEDGDDSGDGTADTGVEPPEQPTEVLPQKKNDKGLHLNDTAQNMMRRAGNVGKLAKIELKSRAKKLPKTAYKLAKGAVVGAAAATAVGIVGATAAIATGEEKNAITAAGATAGTFYAAGRRAANSSVRSHLSPETRAALDEMNNTDEDRKRKAAEASRKKRNDAAFRIRLQNSLTDKDYDKQIKKARDNNADARTIRQLEQERRRRINEKADKYLADGGAVDELYQSGVRDDAELATAIAGIDERKFNDASHAKAHLDLYHMAGNTDYDHMKTTKEQDNQRKLVHNAFKKQSGDKMTEKEMDERYEEIKDLQSYLYNKLN